MTQNKRIDGRSPSELRHISIENAVNPYAEGSVIVAFGNTRVHVTASIEQEVPRWLKDTSQGWVTAEYGMLPRATHTRNRREASAGKQSGRTSEIQRLIGRSLRASLDLNQIPGLTIVVDCDVLVADGGTRTASITGAWVAVANALKWANDNALIQNVPSLSQIVAVSVGVSNGQKILDLCYEEDSTADFDLNLVFNDEGELVEIQGTAEGRALKPTDVHELTLLAWDGAKEILELQREASLLK